MAVTWTGTGGLGTRLGKLIYLLNSVNKFRGTADLSGASAVSVGTSADNINAQYASANQQLVTGLYQQRDSYRSVHTSFVNYLKELAQNTFIKMFEDDVKLTTKDLTTALGEAKKQLVAASASFNRPTVSIPIGATAASYNNGTGVVIGSVIDKYGNQFDTCFNETLDILCTQDSQQGGTLGRETFSVKGDAAQADPLMWDWELGSGCSLSINAVDANSTSSSILTDGDFEAWSSNTPTSWTIATGTAGTTVFAAGSSDAYTNSNALKITGTGAELTSLTQDLTTALASKPNGVYAINAWLKVSAVPSAGVVEIALVDGSGTIITDDASTDNKLRIDLTALTTSYKATGAMTTELLSSTKPFFRLPKVLPSTIKLRVRLSTALDNAKSVFIDRLAMAAATQCYDGGPYIAAFSGATKWVINDFFSHAVSNNYGGLLLRAFERLFQMRQKGIAFPSSGSPTISDSLIAA